MMEIQVKPSGALAVVDVKINGNVHRARDYESWGHLFREWGPRWCIDIRRTVWVRPEGRSHEETQG